MFSVDRVRCYKFYFRVTKRDEVAFFFFFLINYLLLQFFSLPNKYKFIPRFH